MLLIALTGVFVLSGCDDPIRGDLGSGLPDQVWQGIPPYEGTVNSVGTLTEAYIQNTESLLTVNNRMLTLCVAYNKCEEED